MKNERSTSLRILTSLGLMACIVMACLAPEPDPVPRRWQLDLTTGPMRVFSVDDAVSGRRQFLYMTYKVVNNTGQDLLLAPAFDLANDEGDLIRSGRDVPSGVTTAVIEQLGNPLIQDQIAILGTISQGVENARFGVVVWAADNLDVDELVVFAGGFSGETKGYDTLDPRTGQTVRAMLRKALMVRYNSAGILGTRGNEPIEVLEQRWVMR